MSRPVMGRVTRQTGKRLLPGGGGKDIPKTEELVSTEFYRKRSESCVCQRYRCVLHMRWER
jgi:hypothetical protein